MFTTDAFTDADKSERGLQSAAFFSPLFPLRYPVSAADPTLLALSLQQFLKLDW